MSENEDLLKVAIEIAQKESIDEVIAQRIKGKTYQIRFSNSLIDNSKIWNNDILELFLAKGKRTTQIDIEAPTPTKIRNTITKASKFLLKLPESFLYNGMESNLHTHKK